jgi:hypothetical protein
MLSGDENDYVTAYKALYPTSSRRIARMSEIFDAALAGFSHAETLARAMPSWAFERPPRG